MQENNIPVLYISFDGLTDPLGRSQVIPYLIGLSKRNFKVYVLSLEKPNAFTKEGNKVKELLAINNIDWRPLEYKQSIPILTPMVLVRKLYQVAEEIYHSKQVQIVHCRSYMSALVGLKLKRKYATKFIFDMRGFWADERVDGGLWNLRNPLFRMVYSYFKKKEILFINEADSIISLTHNAKKVILDYPSFIVNEDKITVIPCCVDHHHFDRNAISSTKRIQFQKELGINDDDFVLGYLGSIGTWYLLDEMLDFFKVLLEHKAKAKFLFVSKDEKLVYDAARAKKIPLSKILVKPVSYDDVPVLLSLSTISIFFIKPVFSKKASSPVKQGELMAMGIPIICNSDIGDTDYVINHYQCGSVINQMVSSEYEELAQNIDQIVQVDPKNGIQGALEFYSLEKGIERYFNAYHKTLSE